MNQNIRIEPSRLAATRFLSGLPEQSATTLSACAREITIGRGGFLAHESRTADEFFVIERGLVAIELLAPGRGPLIVATVGKGQLVGWSWLFSPRIWHFDAVALELTQAIAFDAEAVRQACDADPELRHELTGRVARAMSLRLEGIQIQLLDLYGSPS